MMLSLSAHLPTAVVYERARDHFTADEIAEAFAATGGVTIPGELRTTLSSMDHDALAEFRALAPPREAIKTQRWTRRRVTALVVLVATVALALWVLILNQTIVSGLL